MAVFNSDVSVPANTWTQLTIDNVSAIRIHNRSLFSIELAATFGVTTPTTTSGGLPLEGGETLSADLTLAQLFPGVTGANRVWAFSPVPVVLSVSHA